MTQPASPPARSSLWGLAVVLLLVFGAMQAWTGWRHERQGEAVKALARPGQITMYTTTTCPYCAKAKVWLDGHGIPWRECNIDLHANCRMAFEAQGAPGVPLLHVRGHWQLGFDPQWLKRVLQDEGPQLSPSTERSPRP